MSVLTMSLPATDATTPLRATSLPLMKPGIRYVTMLAESRSSKPPRIYFAALLPLWRKWIMLWKALQGEFRGCTYYIGSTAPVEVGQTPERVIARNSPKLLMIAEIASFPPEMSSGFNVQ